MIIAVAGPYSADNEEKMQANLDAMNKAAAKLLENGHIPLIGVHAALPVVKGLHGDTRKKAIMDISMALVGGCEALLLLSESPGANLERDLILSKGLPVYHRIEDVPAPEADADIKGE